jgi:CRP/FNR family cyclic AMP-dependent transcriptional regulator
MARNGYAVPAPISIAGPTRGISASHCQHCAIRQECVFGRLDDAERAFLEPQIRQRVFHRGDALVEEGKVASFVRIVKLGTAFAYRHGLDGRSRPIGVIGRGNAFGIFGVFDSPSQASVVALTTVRICEIPVVGLRNTSTCGSKLLVQMTRAVVETFAAITAWSEAMRLSGVINQLAYILVLLADANKASLVALPSHSALAELLGTRRESVARALGTLESEGGIHRHERKRCEVFRSKLLARLSQGTR